MHDRVSATLIKRADIKVFYAKKPEFMRPKNVPVPFFTFLRLRSNNKQAKMLKGS